MMKTALKFALMISCVLCGFALVTTNSQAEEPQPPIRILWVGSSSIYYHNQPKITAEWLTKSGTPAESELVGKSGTGIHVYLRPEFKAEYGMDRDDTILEKIARERYDFVVLQIPAEFITSPEGEEHDHSLDIYCKAISEAGGEPVFYEMGWQRNEAAECGRELILKAAKRNQVTHFAPCSSSWKRVREERPELELQNPPDLTHPGTLGCYLNVYAFCMAITGEPPKQNNTKLHIWQHLSDEEKKQLAEKVATAEFDEYDSKLAGWMRRQILGGKNMQIDDEVAEYLRDVAEDEYAKFQNILR